MINLKSILFLFVLCLSFAISAQNRAIDSLENLLQKHSTNDTVSYKVCLKIGVRWESLNFDSAMYYYNRALHLSEQNEWPDKKAKVLGNIGMAYAKCRGSEVALDYLQKSLDIYQETGNKKGKLEGYYYLGTLNTHFQKYLQGIELLNKAVKLGIALNNKPRLADIYNNLGLTYYYTGQYEKASIYQFKSIQIREKSKNKKVRYNHINIGLTYLDQKNFEKSLEHYNKALDLFLETNEKKNIALIYKSIGDIYMNMNKYDSSINYYNKAYIIYREMNDLVSISRYYMMMGTIYQDKGLINKAALTYQQALDTLPTNGSKSLLFAIYSNLADLNLDMADSSKNNKTKLLNHTIVNSKKMVQIAHELGSISKETESYEKLYKAYTKIGNTKVALKYAEKFINSKDSLFSVQKEKTIADIQTKYETEKKELEIELLNSENNLISNKLSQSDKLRKKQRVSIYLLIGGVILVCIIIIIVYRFYLQKRKANKKLIAQNTIIKKQKEEKELLVNEIHHRVKNNLQIISSLFDLQMRGTDNPDTKSSLIDGLNRIKSVGLIHQLLYESDDVISIDFNDFVTKLVDHITSFAADKPINQDIIIPEGLHFDIITTIPLGLIITELLTNSFKYAFDNVETCRISVKLEKINNDQFKLEVDDNGVGLPSEFNFDTSKSLGLRLVRTLSKQLSGDIVYKFDQGASFVLVFSRRTPHE